MTNIIDTDTATAFIIAAYATGVAAGYLLHKFRQFFTADED